METGEQLEVAPEYASSFYKERMAAHIAELKKEAEAAGLSYKLLPTDRPLDEALREYLIVRQGRL
jgi:hypothetical protein